MTANMAFNKLCSYMNDEPTIMSAREYKDVFGFYVAQSGSDPNKPAFVGRSMICVDKKTGKVFPDEDRKYTSDIYIPVNTKDFKHFTGLTGVK